MKNLWILFVLLSLSSRAAIYYVNFGPGNDTLSGTSEANAWDHCPGDNNATSTAGATILLPGDTVRFNSASPYTGTIFLTRNGSSGSYITYDGTTWGGGRTRHTTAFAPGTSAWQISTGTTTKQYNFIHGFEVLQVGGWPYNDPVFSGSAGSITAAMSAARYGAGFNFLAPASFNIISNCYIHEIGHWTNVTQNATETTITGNGINFERGGTNNIVISNILSKMSHCIDICSRSTSRAVGNRFIGNVLTNTFRWGYNFSAKSANAYFEDNVVIGGLIGDYSEYDAINWLGVASGDSPHTDGVIVANNDTTYINNTWISNGVDGVRFYSDFVGNPSNAGGTASIFITRGPSFFVRNCEFLSPRHPVMGISVAHPNNTGPTQHVHITHNTFRGTGWPIRATLGTPIQMPWQYRRVSVNNNLFVGTGSSVALLIEHDNRLLVSLNGNVYWNTSLSQGVWNVGNIVGVDTTAKFDDLRAAGYEANGFYGDPLFTSAISPWRTANMASMTGGSVINRGLNLTNMVLSDFNRVSRVGKQLTVGSEVFTSGTPADTTAPTPNPLTWTIEPHVIGQNTIEMAWSAATDDSGDQVTYTVVESTGNPGCAGIVTTNTSFANDSIPLATLCGYSVYATDPTGNSGTASDVVFASTPAAPFTPSHLLASVTISSMVISNAVPMTNLYYFNAEGTGTPAGFTNVGVVDWDHAGLVYEGFQSFIATNSIFLAYTTTGFAPLTNSWHTFAFARDQVGSIPRKMFWLLSGTNEQAVMYFSTNGIGFTHGSVSNTVTTVPLVGNAYYRALVNYQSGTGSDGIMHVWVATNGVFTSGWSNSITTGTGTTAIDAIVWGHDADLPNNRFYYDEAFGRVTAIGNNPTP